MTSSLLLSLLHRYPLAGPLLLSLKPPAEFAGLHVVVGNLIEAIRWARDRFVPSPLALAALQAELECLLAELNATVTRSSLDPSGNVVEGSKGAHPEYAFWSIENPGAYRRESETVAAVAFLRSRGRTLTKGQLDELRRGLEEEARPRKDFERISKTLVADADAATVLHARDGWDEDSDDVLDVDEVLAGTGDYPVVEAATEREARSLAASIHGSFRRSFTRAGAYAPVGDRAKVMVAELRRRASGEAPCAAAITLLLSIFFQQPAGAVVRRVEWARLGDECELLADDIWRIDPDRGLASIPIVGFDSFWRPDPDLAEYFAETDGSIVVALPGYLVEALRRLRGDRTIGPVIPDSLSLRSSLLQLVSQLRVRMGGRLSVRRIAGTLGFAVFEATRDMAALQRLAGHDLNDSLARGSYYCATHAQLQPPLEAGLNCIGLTDADNPLPSLPAALAKRLNGARRLPRPRDTRDLAKKLNDKLRAASRAKPETRAEALTSLLAIHAAALLMLAASHRWSGAIGELTRWDVCPQAGLGVFADKPVDALHARRIVMLPSVLRRTLQSWLDYCEWLVRLGSEGVAERALMALNGEAPLLFLVERGTVSPLTLSSISAAVGPVGTAVLRGSRCLISSSLRQVEIDAPRIDAQLGHSLYGETSFDPANLESPHEFLGPVAKATDRMLRDFGFRSWDGAPARSQRIPVTLSLPAPWSPQISSCVADADALATREREAFAVAVDALIAETQPRATLAIGKLVAERMPLDRKAIRGVFVQLCAAGEGSAASAVAAGRAVQAALHQFRRQGIESEGISFYEPAFPTPPWLSSRHLIAWHVQRSCLTWLHDPNRWSYESFEGGAARFTLLMIAHGVVADVHQALAVIDKLPSLRPVESVRGALAVPVNWPTERREMPAETVWLMGDLALVALALLEAGGCEAISPAELTSALMRALRTSPWPLGVEGIDEILSGWHATASLSAVLTQPGAIASRTRGALPTRDLPVDLCRAVLDNVAAAPPPPADRAEMVSTEGRKRGPAISDAKLISEVRRRLEGPSPATNLHALAKTVAGPQRVVAELASRLSTLAGDKVDHYAVGSQLTYLSLVAAPLLDALKVIDLGNAAVVESCLLALWNDAEPDPRRLIGLHLAAEVLEDLFLWEPLDLDGLPNAPSVRKFPRALMPAPATWSRRDEVFGQILNRLSDPDARIALCVSMDSLAVQSAFQLRTGEAEALRHCDVGELEGTFVARVAPHKNAVLKSPNAIRNNEIAHSHEIARIADGFVGQPANALCFARKQSGPKGGMTRGDLFREVTADRRLRPHDLRSTQGSMSLLDTVAVLDERGQWQLRSNPDNQGFREASARLGHGKTSTTFASYVHFVGFWQALRLERGAGHLTLMTIAGLVGLKADAVKERVRAVAGAQEGECRTRRLVGLLARAHVLPWPVENGSDETVDEPAIAGAFATDAARLSKAIHALKDGSSVDKVASRSGLPEALLTSLFQSVVEVAAGLGLGYLPAGGQALEVAPSVADLRVLAVSNPRVTIDAAPSGSQVALTTRVLSKVDSRNRTFCGLSADEVCFLLAALVSRDVRWDIRAAIPAHLADREEAAMVTLGDVELQAGARHAKFKHVKTARKRSCREITYSARVRGAAKSVKGPALVEALLISLGLATNPATTPTQPR